MKAIAIFWILFYFFLAHLGCGINDNGKGKISEDTAGAGLKVKRHAGWIPPGANIERDGSTVHIQTLEKWSYIGYDRNRNVVYGTKGFSTSFSCSCDGPVISKTLGNSETSGGLLACTEKDCPIFHQLESHDEHVLTGTGGYFEPGAPVRLLHPGEQAPAAFDALFLELPAFKETLLRFLIRAHGGTQMQLPVKNSDGSVSAPSGYALIAISVMGRGLITIVPEEFLKTQPGYPKMVKATCDCTNGSYSLKNYTTLGTGSLWCEGNSTAITTLTTGNIKDTQQNIKLYSFKF